MRRQPRESKGPESDAAQGQVEAQVAERIGPFLEGRGYDLIEVTYRRERRGWVLRLTVDRFGGGFSVDDGVSVTRDVGAFIDADPALDALLVGPYHLEVSSPGIFRELKRPRDFERAWGKRVKVRCRRADDDGTDVIVGTLAACDERTLRVERDAQVMEIAMDDVRSVKLHPTLPFGKS